MLTTFANLLSNLLIESLLYIVILISFSIIFLVRYRFNYIRRSISKEEDIPISQESSLSAVELKKFSPFEYYKFVREEIRREDDLTNHRLTWSLTFQGFIISALAIIIIGSTRESISLYIIQRLALVAIGVIGLLTSFLAFKGILAARISLGRARSEWQAKNAVWNLHPKYVPQPVGQGATFDGGTHYVERIPGLFAWMWSFFLVGYLLVTYFVDVRPCVSAEDFLSCVRGVSVAPVASSSAISPPG